MAEVWQFLQGHPKPAFSEKVQREDQKTIFQKSPKSSPPLKGPKGHWGKWHYPELTILGDFKILAFQNPKFKILADFKILAFQNTEFKILCSFRDSRYPKS